MRHRNRFGGLPIYMACSVAVPMVINRLVLAQTLIAECESTTMTTNSSHSLVWSAINYGYTPIDLKWIRHIEARHRFFLHRSFYPLDARGVWSIHDNLNDNLLRQAVDLVLGQLPQTMIHNLRNLQPDTNATMTTTTTSSEIFWYNSTVGLLLHWIILVVRASFRDSSSRSPLSSDILHQAACLSSPNGPTLPQPVLELIMWQHPEQSRATGPCWEALKLEFSYIYFALRGSITQTTRESIDWISARVEDIGCKSCFLVAPLRARLQITMACSHYIMPLTTR